MSLLPKHARFPSLQIREDPFLNLTRWQHFLVMEKNKNLMIGPRCCHACKPSHTCLSVIRDSPDKHTHRHTNWSSALSLGVGIPVKVKSNIIYITSLHLLSNRNFNHRVMDSGALNCTNYVYSIILYIPWTSENCQLHQTDSSCWTHLWILKHGNT